MIQALHCWRHYLLPQEFVLFSDSEALKYIYSQKKLSTRHGRWIEFLQDYTSTLRHKTGIENKVVNALSRRIFILTKMTTVISGFERVRTKYESCPDFHEIYAKLKDEITREVDGFVLHDGYLFLSRKICISRTSLREFLVWELHAGGLDGHFGNEKTIKAVEYKFH